MTTETEGTIGQRGDPRVTIGELLANDCRTVCHALKHRAAEFRKVATKLRALGREHEAKLLDAEAADITTRLGPTFDTQGSFDFSPVKAKPFRPFGNGKRGKGKTGPRDLAESERDRIGRGGR